jgi:hypothetical protein
MLSMSDLERNDPIRPEFLIEFEYCHEINSFLRLGLSRHIQFP